MICGIGILPPPFPELLKHALETEVSELATSGPIGSNAHHGTSRITSSPFCSSQISHATY